MTTVILRPNPGFLLVLGDTETGAAATQTDPVDL
jgi:hypothetical protein